MLKMRTVAATLAVCGVAFGGSVTIAVGNALASEQLWLNEAETTLAPVGTTWAASNVGNGVLKAGTLTVECKKSTAAGKVTANSTESLTSSVTNDTFTECTDQLGNTVTVKSETTAFPWTLGWVKTATLELTGVKKTFVEDPSLGQDCEVENEAGKAFTMTWTNATTDSTLAASKQPLKLKAPSGKTCTPTSGEESVTYSVKEVNESAGNLWMS